MQEPWSFALLKTTGTSPEEIISEETSLDMVPNKGWGATVTSLYLIEVKGTS